MIEWHGWATIGTTPAAVDDLVTPETINAVQQLVMNAQGVSNEVVDLRAANGLHHLWLAGCHNHNASVVSFYEKIAAAAPGSYGVLYVHDDEGPEEGRNAWRTFVMRRGVVILEQDTFLSPHIGLVEDADPLSTS